jgi:hypothetical protein
MAKKKLVILDENAHWWAKQKLDWATQDKDGHWWIIPGSEFAEKTIDKKNMKIKKRKLGQSSLRVSVNFFLLILLSSILGISLALNLILYFL